MAAWLYEGMLLFGVVFVISYVFSVLTNTRHALDHRMAQQFTVFFGFGGLFHLAMAPEWPNIGNEDLAHQTGRSRWSLPAGPEPGGDPVPHQLHLVRTRACSGKGFRVGYRCNGLDRHCVGGHLGATQQTKPYQAVPT